MLRMAIGAVKDQTSIACATSYLDVAVLKATSHDEVPAEDRHVDEVVLLASCSRAHAATCVRAISRRLARTRSWVVALKSLSLVSRAIAGAGTIFLLEVAAASRRGVRLLDLSCFRHDSFPSAPRELVAFVRSFALYLDERLDSALAGKLDHAGLRGMNPPAVLDRVATWQRALDRSIAAWPAGTATVHRLVQIALYTVVRESFDLYRGVSEGLALVLGSFFQLQPWTCVGTYRACAKAAQQFEDLEAFYCLCMRIGVGRAQEYPVVQKISMTNLAIFNEFLQTNKATADIATTVTPRKWSGPPPLQLRPDATEKTQLKLPAPATAPQRGQITDLATNNKEKPEATDGKNSVVSGPPPPAKASTSGAGDEWEQLLAESATAILNRRGCYSFSEVLEPTAAPAPFSLGRAPFSVTQQGYNPFLLDEAGDRGASAAAVQPPPAGAPCSATSVPPPSALQTGEPVTMQQLLQQEQQRRGCSNLSWSQPEMYGHDLALL